MSIQNKWEYNLKRNVYSSLQIHDNLKLICYTLASEYPHFKSFPINIAFQLVNDLLSYCKHNCCKAEIVALDRDCSL